MVTLKRILLISYHFPPSDAVGGKRTASFERYLPDFSWDPFVLTLSEKYIDKKDWTILRDHGNGNIYRVGKLPTMMDGYAFLKRLLKKIQGKTSEEHQRYEQRDFMQEKQTASESISGKLKRYIYALFLSLPDFERNWIGPAVLKGYRLIKEKDIQCILTSSPPHSVHLIGFILKMLLDVKWISDFRDPWMSPFTKGLYHTCSLSNSIERFLERNVIKKSDLVVCNTDMLADKFMHHFGSISKARIICLPNGFDPDAFSGLQRVLKYEVFTICYTGTLYLGRTPEPVLRAINELILEKRIEVEDVKIKLVGNCQYFGGIPTKEIISRYGLEAIVEVMAPVPHHVCLEIMKKSHICLLLSSGQPYQIPAKVYDYIGSGTNILAIAEDGASEKLVRSLNNGKVVKENDIAGMKDFIIACMNKTAPESREGDNNVSQFNRKVIVSRLAEQLDELCRMNN